VLTLEFHCSNGAGPKTFRICQIKPLQLLPNSIGKCREQNTGKQVGSEVRPEEAEMTWLALAAMTLAAAIGFNVLAVTIQGER
jgi:hypothetical protein